MQRTIAIIQILKLMESKLKLVAINHYRDLYMAIGVALEITFSTLFDNNGLGLIFGLAIGMTIGANMDKKAAKEDKQLNLQNKC